MPAGEQNLDIGGAIFHDQGDTLARAKPEPLSEMAGKYGNALRHRSVSRVLLGCDHDGEMVGRGASGACEQIGEIQCALPSMVLHK